MKKKKLLLLLTSFSTISAIAAGIAVAGSGNNSLSIRGQNEPSTFVLDYSTVHEEEGDNSYTAKLVSPKGASITIGIEGAIFKDDAFYVSGYGRDFYFYNKDPIRGIAGASITFANDQTNDHKDSYDLDINSMFSYNEIEFPSVLDGSKYKDLLFLHSSVSGSGDLPFSESSLEHPELEDVQYFLCHVIPTYNANGTYIKSMTIDSVCGDDLDPVEEGENNGTFSSSDKNQINESYGESLVMKNAGNPAYFWDGSNYLCQLYKNGTTAPLIERILSNEFVLTTSMYGTDVYQKRIGSTVHTIYVWSESHTYCNVLKTSYSDSMDYFETDEQWPSSYLDDHISEMHRGLIPDLNSTTVPSSTDKIASYLYNASESGSRRTIGVMINFNNGVYNDDILTIAQDYIALFDTNVWTISGGELIYSDGLLEIDIYNTGSNLVIEIDEVITSLTPPTQEQIAEYYNISEPSCIYIVEGEEGASYSSYSGGSYRIYKPGDNAVNSALIGLEAAGYTLKSSSEIRYIYTKDIDFLTSIEVEIEINDTYLLISYRADEGGKSRQFDSFSEMIEYVCRYKQSVINNIVSNMTLDENFEYYYVSKNGDRVGYIKNAGSTFVNELEEAGTYIEVYDAYKYGPYNRLLKIDEVSGGVALKVIQADATEFVSYIDANNTINEYLSNLNLDQHDPSLAVLFNDSDNLGDRFTCNWDNITYFGTLEEVNAVKQLFINRINENGAFVYSSYLNKYFNTDTNFAYYFEGPVGSYGVYQITIYFNNAQQYDDYKSYNELDLGNPDKYPILADFPVFIENSQKEENYFVVSSSNENSLTLDVRKDAGLDDSYIYSLIQDGFVAENYYNYTKIDGPYQYTFSVSGYGDYWSVTYGKNGPWYSHDDLIANIKELRGQSFVDVLENEFNFSEHFSSETPAYDFDNMTGDIKFAKTSEVNDYTNYLCDNLEFASVYSSDSGIYGYAKMNETNTEFWRVNTNYFTSYSTLNFKHETYSFTSWDDIEDILSSSSLKYEEMSEALAFPSGFEGDVYSVDESLITNGFVSITINKSCNLESYIQTLEETCYSVDYYGETGRRFSFVDGEISVVSYYTKTVVNITGNIYDGKYINEPIVIENEGNTPIEFRSTLTYFSFTPSKSSNYTITSVLSEGYYWETECYLYNETGEESLSYNSCGGENGQFLITYDLVAGTTYLIAPKLCYDKNNRVIPGTLIIQDNAYEGETIDTAIEVFVGTTNTKFRSDLTYYEFTPEESGTYYFTSNCEYGTYATLMDNEGHDLKSSSEWNEYQFYLSYALQAEQTYYLSVGCSNGAYKRAYDGTLTIGIYDLEYNGDTKDKAIEIVDGGSNIITRGTWTYYEFELETAGDYYIYIYSDDSGSFEICDEGDSDYNSYYFSRFEESYRLIKDLSAGTHYLKIKLRGTDNPFYESNGYIGIISGDISYDGDSINNNPLAIGLGTNDVSFRKDVIYYKFVPEESGYYYFTSAVDFDTYGYLCDSTGNELISDDDSGKDNNFMIVYSLEEGQIYYLKARLYSSENPFNVLSGQINVVKFNATIHDGTSENPIVINLNETHNYINYFDETYFVFTPQESGAYELQCSFENNSGSVYLYDSSKNLISSWVNYYGINGVIYSNTGVYDFVEGETYVFVSKNYEKDPTIQSASSITLQKYDESSPEPPTPPANAEEAANLLNEAFRAYLEEDFIYYDEDNNCYAGNLNFGENEVFVDEASEEMLREAGEFTIGVFPNVFGESTSKYYTSEEHYWDESDPGTALEYTFDENEEYVIYVLAYCYQNNLWVYVEVATK